jgi:hypothetical protein
MNPRPAIQLSRKSNAQLLFGKLGELIQLLFFDEGGMDLKLLFGLLWGMICDYYLCKEVYVWEDWFRIM